ncbi:hypothetical protein [Pelagerythrobacter sp.]|uniref:hypothetical protein n=1 Tax=Pelagerythrobacter sp. TaxID=2800702 RepID=UPI0035B193F3
MTMTAKLPKMPGRLAPAFLFAVMAFSPVSSAMAQAQVPAGQVQPPPSIRPTPSQLELSKMIWSTMAAVDHANRSGNYSVLRDISAQGFQINNDAARLAEVFAGIRRSRIDLSNALLIPPTYTQAPQLVREDVFRVQGMFQMRPISLSFDMYFQWEQGEWKLFGIDIQPLEMTTGQP